MPLPQSCISIAVTWPGGSGVFDADLMCAVAWKPPLFRSLPKRSTKQAVIVYDSPTR